MRNSALPIISVLLLVGFLVFRLESLPTSEPGALGPELVNGIFRLPTKARLRLPSAAVESTNVVTASAPEGADGTSAERFRVVVVAVEDHAPLTAALVLALCERLTENGTIVLIDTLHDRPLQLPADRVLCVSTRSGSLPETPGGACSADVLVVDRLLAFPVHSAAARAQAAISEPTTVRFTITHKSHATGTEPMKWGNWYAAVGRGLATDLLATMVPAGVPQMRDGGQRPRTDLPERPDWLSAIPAPPFVEPVRWFGALQEDFVRGWLGELPSLESFDEHGQRMPAIERLETTLRSARVVKEAAWTIDDHSTADMKMWNRDQECLVALKRTDGWDLHLWQQRPGVVALYRTWLEAAATGSVSARERLLRYQNCTVIPADERAHASAFFGGGTLDATPPGSPAPSAAPALPAEAK